MIGMLSSAAQAMLACEISRCQAQAPRVPVHFLDKELNLLVFSPLNLQLLPQGFLLRHRRVVKAPAKVVGQCGHRMVATLKYNGVQ